MDGEGDPIEKITTPSRARSRERRPGFNQFLEPDEDVARRGRGPENPPLPTASVENVIGCHGQCERAGSDAELREGSDPKMKVNVWCGARVCDGVVRGRRPGGVPPITCGRRSRLRNCGLGTWGDRSNARGGPGAGGGAARSSARRALAAVWSGACRSARSGSGQTSIDLVDEVDVEVMRTDEFTYERFLNSVDLDLDYLSPIAK